MNYESISDALKKRAHDSYEKNAYFSVLIPLILVEDEPHLLFEVRSYELESQPGEICFPGGKMEPGEHASQTALRETKEELNLNDQQLKIVGSLPPLTTPFHYTIYPYCGVIQHMEYHDIRYSKDEVDSIFTAPLAKLLTMTPDKFDLNYRMELDPSFPYHLIPNGKSYDWKSGGYQVIFYHYEDKVIWGLTAKMLKFFLDSIRHIF